jgi:PAS domain S-box-containing protein
VLIVDEDLNLVSANPAYARLVGAESVDTLEGHNLWDSPALDSKAVRHVVGLANSGEKVTVSLSYESIFGKTVDARAHIAPIKDEGGEVGGAQILFEDISESRLLEDQLRQSQKMEALGRLAGGVAHDFNNYLTAILGWAAVLSDEAQPDSVEYEAADQIVQAAERSSSLTRQLLAFGRRGVVKPSLIDLADVVKRVEPMLHRVLGETIRLECSRDLALPQIEADPALLEQVVVNLAVNARDAMPDGGVVRVGVRSGGTFEIDAPGERRSVQLVVQDDGVGMDDVTRGRVFEPFFTTKTDGRGTGLGLSTVYGIVQQCGGRVEVESTLGSGALFRITFPEADSNTALEPPGETAQPGDAAGNERILLVEDEPMVLRFTQRVLEQNGYEVLAAANGEAALDIAQREGHRIDLLLTDVMMPGLGGVELVSKLHAARPDLPVLFISGYSEAPVSTGGAPSDGVDLLQKPFPPKALRERVREILDRSATRAPSSP